MRILVYGFGPYRKFHDNITAHIVRHLPKRPGLKKVVFPVRFQRRQFADVLDRDKPEIILGLGQSSRKHIEVESRAKNHRRARKIDKRRAIFVRRPRVLPTTLAIRPICSVGKSNDAGDYVCNYSMYVLLDEIARRDLPTRFGFVHIPHDTERAKALKIIAQILQRCRRSLT